MKTKVNVKEKVKEYQSKWNSISKKNKRIICGVIAGSVLGLCCIPMMIVSNNQPDNVIVSSETSSKKKEETSVDKETEKKDDNKLSTSDKKQSSNTNKTESVKEMENKDNSNKNGSSNISSSTNSNSNSSGSTNSESNASTKKDTGNTAGSSSSPAKPNQTSEPTHTHSWKEVTTTIHHDAITHVEKVLVSEAYDEPTYKTVYKDICNDCGADITGNANGHLLETEHGSFTGGVPFTTQTGIIHHGAVYDEKTVVDQVAYDEVVVTGYKCSCGATK